MRFTISRCMAATALLGLNIGLARTYVLAELRSEHLEVFDFGFFIFFTLEFGLWRYLRTRGRRRRFWLGCEIAGLAATLGVGYLSLFEKDISNSYWEMAADLSYFYLPAHVDSVLLNDHPDGFLAIICFLPEFIAATLGGLLAMTFFRRAGKVPVVATSDGEMIAL